MDKQPGINITTFTKSHSEGGDSQDEVDEMSIQTLVMSFTLPGIPPLFASGKFSFVLSPHSKFTSSVEFLVLKPDRCLLPLCCLSTSYMLPYAHIPFCPDYWSTHLSLPLD